MMKAAIKRDESQARLNFPEREQPSSFINKNVPFTMEKMKVKMVQKQGGLYYPQIETKEVVNVVESVVKRNCLFQRGALIGVLSVVGEEMKRLLNEGYIVEVPGVGKFYPFARQGSAKRRGRCRA